MNMLSECKSIKQFLWKYMENNSSCSTHHIFKKDFDFDLYAILIHSSHPMICKLTAQKHVSILTNQNDCEDYNDEKGKIIEQEFSSRGQKTTIRFIKHGKHLEFDFYINMNASQEKNMLYVVDFIKDIIQQKSVSIGKHVIIIHFIDKIPLQILNALKNIIERYHENAYFVFTCHKLNSTIINGIFPLCLYIKNNLDAELFCKSYLADTNNVNFDDKNMLMRLRVILKKNKNDFINACLLWSLPDAEFFNGHIVPYLDDLLNKMYTTNEKSINMIDVDIKNISQKLGTTCYSFASIAKIIIQIVTKKYPDHISDVIHLSAKYDHCLKICNKEFFVLEMYFHEIFDVLNK